MMSFVVVLFKLYRFVFGTVKDNRFVTDLLVAGSVLKSGSFLRFV
jgi:hypothetical protein